MRRGLALVVLLAALPLVGDAAKTVTYSQPSSLGVGTTAPVARLDLGAGGASARFATGLTQSLNMTAVTGTLKLVPGADLTVKDVVRVSNPSAGAITLTLRATQVTQAAITTLAWSVLNGATPVGTLDAKASSPSLTFALAAGATYKLDLHAVLAEGAGANNASPTLDLRLVTGSGQQVTHALTAIASAPTLAEARMAPRAAGTSAGVNGTNAVAPATKTLVATASNLLWLNNTSGANEWYARFVVTSTSGLANMAALTIGLNNGTSNTELSGSTGAMTQTTGPWVKLSTSSANTVTIVSAVTSLAGATVSIGFDVQVADDASGTDVIVEHALVTV